MYGLKVGVSENQVVEEGSESRLEAPTKVILGRIARIEFQLRAEMTSVYSSCTSNLTCSFSSKSE